MDPIVFKMLTNPTKFIYILKELGDLTFTKIAKISGFSRNTVAKHLNELISKGYIEKKIISNGNERESIGYSITVQGLQKFQPEFLVDRKTNWLISLSQQIQNLDHLFAENLISESIYNEKKTFLTQIEARFYDLLNFSRNTLISAKQEKQINKLVGDIGNLALKFGEDFFQEKHDIFLQLAVIWIFFNSIEHFRRIFREDEFIEIYGLSDDFIRQEYRGLCKKCGKIILSDDELCEYCMETINLDRKHLSKFKKDIIRIRNQYSEFSKEFVIIINRIRNENSDPKEKESFIKNLAKNPKLNIQSIDEIELIFQEYVEYKQEFINSFRNSIQYILDENFGVNSFTIGNQVFYFHDKDIVGSILSELIDNAINKQIIQKRIFGLSGITSLSDLSNEITTTMAINRFIPADENFKYTFNNLVLNRLFKRAVDLGLSDSISMGIYDEMFKSDSMELYKKIYTDQSLPKTLISEMEWINQLYNSIKGKRAMFKASDVSEIKGFCANCGHPILIETEKCEFCGKNLDIKKLIYDIKIAKQKLKEYKSTLYLDLETNTFEFKKCENCGSIVGRTWERCPACKNTL